MKIKKFLAVFMSVLMLCSVFFSVSASALILYSGGFKYEPSTSKLAEILGLESGSELESAKTITIPSSIKGYSIYRIGKNAFSYNDVHEEIIMPSTITEIGDYAFTESTALKTVTIPKNVQIMGVHAFSRCTSLENVTFETTRLSVIPRTAFYYCASLESVILPESINTIDTMAFATCSNLKKIYIPSTVSSVTSDAFLYSNNLTIYGESGSTIYYYALSNNIPFVELSGEKVFTELENSITTAQAKLSGDTSEYSQDVVTQLQTEINNALALKDDFFTTQSDIDTAAQNITKLCNMLMPAYLTQLEEAIAQGNALLENSAIYTAESVKELSDAITSAQAVMDKANPTEDEAQSMVTLVNEKINALVLQSKENLQNLVNSVEITIEASQYQYTEASINDLVDALEEAIKVLEDSNSNDATYRAEYNTLMQVYDTIVPLTKGDINFDGEITVADALLVIKNVVGNNQFNEREAYAADLSSDNIITVLDAVMIQRAIVGA